MLNGDVGRDGQQEDSVQMQGEASGVCRTAIRDKGMAWTWWEEH